MPRIHQTIDVAFGSAPCFKQRLFGCAFVDIFSDGPVQPIQPNRFHGVSKRRIFNGRKLCRDALNEALPHQVVALAQSCGYQTYRAIYARLQVIAISGLRTAIGAGISLSLLRMKQSVVYV
jgi:hypothetical protein